MKNIHWMIGASGGVGKSIVCRLLAETFVTNGSDYVVVQAGAGENRHCGYKDLKTFKIDMLKSGSFEIDYEKIDNLIDKIAGSRESKDWILDFEESVRTSIQQYLVELSILRELVDFGCKNIFHIVIPGGGSSFLRFNGLNRKFKVCWEELKRYFFGKTNFLEMLTVRLKQY
ncbi:hypothetical protein [Microbulbifer aggregans]|uniref:hypothetical protein n=1 Tax=Microbulbifer aggregans TaxID=1769779 RepID=UPI001CFF0D1C|nr:hypothetical protein [Microbulbifer aggregans]